MTPKERRERWEAMKRLREEGMTYREIGERFGVSTERARQVIARGPTAKKRGRKRLEDRLSEAEIAAAVEEYRAGSSVPDVARLLGASTPAVARLLADRGVETRGRGQRKKAKRNAEIVKMRRNGSALSEIASRFGISGTAVSRIISRDAPDLRGIRAAQKAERNAEIVGMRRGGATLDEIAAHFNISDSTAWQVIRREAPDLMGKGKGAGAIRARDAEIVKRVRSGQRAVDVARDFGVTNSVAHRAVTAANGGRAEERRRAIEERGAKIERLAREGESTAAIADQVGLSVGRVREIVSVRAPDTLPMWIDRAKRASETTLSQYDSPASVPDGDDERDPNEIHHALAALARAIQHTPVADLPEHLKPYAREWRSFGWPMTTEDGR